VKEKNRNDEDCAGVAETQPSAAAAAAEAPRGPRSAGPSSAHLLNDISSCNSHETSLIEERQLTQPELEHAKSVVPSLPIGVSGPTGALVPDDGLMVFTFTCTPHDIPYGEYQDCWHPDTCMAYWDGDDMWVSNCHTGERYRVIHYQRQRRASSREYYTWYCERENAANPCDENFMRSLSS
jgi:hypothetical protein